MENKSEVAQLLKQMTAEYEAGKRGLEGLAQGTAKHDFIAQRVENMQRCHAGLIALVGNAQAYALLAEAGL